MPINPRRQTLAAGVQASSKRPAAPSSSKQSASGGNGSGGSGTPQRRVPTSRKSMIPRCAGSLTGAGGTAGGEGEGNDNANRENNGRRASGIAAPSPSRLPRREGRSRPQQPPASRKSLGGAILHQSAGASNPATPARKNRRKSLAPALATSVAAAGGGGGTSSSTSTSAPGVGGGSSSSNVDPRDVRDKSYLQSAIRKMVSYLQSRGYPDAASLSVKQLVSSGPSGRDFQNIMTFLFRRVDPTFHQQHSMGTGRHGQQRTDEVVPKFEDEVSAAFRCLGYPFPISKTGLVAVGSPHTWPALIAAIDWLVDVLSVMDDEEATEWAPDEIDKPDEGEEERLLTLGGSTERVEQQFVKFLRKSIVAFLNDNAEECEELEGELLDEFQRDAMTLEQYLGGLDEECGRMKEEIAMLSEEVEGLAEAKQKQEVFARNIENYLNLIQNLTNHKDELTKKVETLVAEKSETEQAMAECSEEIKRLRVTIDSQELSQEDVRRMEREMTRVEEQVARLNGKLEGQVAVLKEARERLSSIYRLLEQRTKEYDAKAVQLKLIPENSKHARGNNFKVKLERERAVESTVSLMGGVDISGVFKPHVMKLTRDYENEGLNEKTRMAELADQIKSADTSIEGLAEEIEVIEGKIACCEEDFETEKERLESEIEDKRRQLELLSAKISSLDDPDGVEAAITRLDAEYRRLQSQMQEQQKQYTSKKKAINDEIRHALELTREYEEYKETKLREMNVYIERRMKEASEISLLDS